MLPSSCRQILQLKHYLDLDSIKVQNPQNYAVTQIVFINNYEWLFKEENGEYNNSSLDWIKKAIT